MTINSTEKNTGNINITENGRRYHEKRRGADRRQSKIPGLRYLIFGGRRKHVRREEDNNGIVIMDFYSQSLFALIIGILCLSLIDAAMTLHLIGHGAQEINPVMAYFLDKGTVTFISAKYILTSGAVIIILLVQNAYLPRLRIRSKNLFIFAIVAFALVVVWEIYLLSKLIQGSY